MRSYRLKGYLEEARVHIERLNELLEEVKTIYPLTVDRFLTLNSYQKNMLDALAFRFSKLQDLVGAKIFREFLNEVGFVTEGRSFMEILREIEKEGIIDVDTWSEFRKARNLIAHDYPYDVEEKVEAINYLVERIPVLMEVVKRIEGKVEQLRNQDDKRSV